MSQLVYRGNLSAKVFPFLTDFQGQTIIVPTIDNTFNRSLTSTEDLDKDVGVPQFYYCHNVIPDPYGFSSVGYDQTIPAPAPAATFTGAAILRSNPLSSTVNGPRYYFAPQPSGSHYTILLGGTTWTKVTNVTPYPSTAKVTYATVQGISYIFFEGVGCYKYNSATAALIPVTLTGLNAANILGIVAFQSYLLAYDKSSVYWSSILDIDYTLNAVDFTPSLLTSSGNIRVEGTRGDITFVTPATFGITVYTNSNIVVGLYSGNTRYPFNFKEIVSSGGCSSADYVAYDSNTGNQYAYTTSGFQVVSANATQTIFPEVTDYLGGQVIEDFDEVSRTFSSTLLSVPMVKRLAAIADRYLIFSYGATTFTHAILYDMVQRRYGKLKITHVSCFEFEYLDPSQADAPRKSIAFLKADGSIYILNASVNLATSKGVLLLGKFQHVRARVLSLEKVELQSVYPNQSISVYDWYSDHGGTVNTMDEVQSYDVSLSNERQRSHEFHVTAKNHSILLIGGFSLSSFVLTFHDHGRR